MSLEKRNSNIELLRIVCILFVIALHYNNTWIGGAINYVTGFNSVLLHFIESAAICAVNCFVLITGYFMVFSNKRKIKKPIDLLLKVVIYGSIMYILGVIAGVIDFDLKSFITGFIPQNYYVVLYCGLFFLSIFINYALCGMSFSDLKKMIIISGIICIGYPTIVDIFENVLGYSLPGANPIAMLGDGDGYTLVHFCFMYLLGAYIRLAEQNGTEKERTTKSYLFIYVVCTLIICIMSFKLEMAWNYCNVFVVLESVALFMFFKKINIENNIINKMAKHVFGVYILHTQTVFMAKVWKPLQIEYYAQQNPSVFLLNFLISIVIVCGIASLIDVILLKVMQLIDYVIIRLPFMNYAIQVQGKFNLH